MLRLPMRLPLVQFSPSIKGRRRKQNSPPTPKATRLGSPLAAIQVAHFFPKKGVPPFAKRRKNFFFPPNTATFPSPPAHHTMTLFFLVSIGPLFLGDEQIALPPLPSYKSPSEDLISRAGQTNQVLLVFLPSPSPPQESTFP